MYFELAALHHYLDYRFLTNRTKEQNLPKDAYLNGVWCPLVFLRELNWAHCSSSSWSMTCQLSAHHHGRTWMKKQFPKSFSKASRVMLKNMSIPWRNGPLTTGSNWTPKSVRKFVYHSLRTMLIYRLYSLTAMNLKMLRMPNYLERLL